MAIVDTKPNEAFKLFKEAAQKGCDEALVNIGLNIANGKIKTENKNKDAVMYMKMAADQDVDMASEIYASWLFEGKICEKDIKEAAKYYKKAADTKDSLIGQYLYRVIKINGYDGCKSDTKTGISYIEKVANQKVPHAIHALGYCYYKGFGVNKDMKKASAYFKEAAEMNFPYSLVSCSIMAINENRFKEAAECLQKGADMKNPECAFNLGMLYMAGVGVEKNHLKGEKYLRFAEERGFKNALIAGENTYTTSDFSLVNMVDFPIPRMNYDKISLLRFALHIQPLKH